MFLEQIKNIILDTNNKNFVVFCHQNPDGDAIGSALATKILLEASHKNVKVISADKLPQKYDFLFDFTKIENIANNVEIKADVALFMECSNVARAGYNNEFLKVSKIINIDHHKVNDFYGDVNWVDTEYCAVCEMIYEIFNHMKIDITKDSAECLYTGILTDTGRFQYSNMKVNVYDIVKDLVIKGVDVNFIYRQIYGRQSKSYISFMRIFFNNLEFFNNNMVACSFISQEQIDKNSISNDDSDGAVDFLRDIEGVELGCFIKPKKDKIYKISMRSKKCVSVYEVAKVFGGGGHKYAAGFEIEADNILEAKQQVLKVILKENLWC